MNILLNENDITFRNNKLETVRGRDEMVQKINCCLGSSMADWFLDTNLGVPYFQQLYRKGITREEVLAIFLNYISNIQGVIAITYIDVVFDVEKRTAKLDFRVRTKDGMLDFSKDF